MRKLIWIVPALLILAFTSCRQQKELVYFEGLNDATIINVTTSEERDYRIRVNDILFVRVLSQNEDINKLFQVAQGTATASNYQIYSEDAMYYNGYTVKEDGNVNIPLLGDVPVEGVTIEEAQKLIQAKADETLIDAIVMVNLANFKVTLLGEVKAPGTYTYFKKQTTILEAVGKAGDLTDYGNRREVLIIRPTINGSESYRVNLQKADLLASERYFIQPNDIIYVPPLRAKGFRLAVQDAGTLITAVSSVLSAASLVMTLIFTLKK